MASSLQGVLAHVQAHLDDDLSLEALAGVAERSPHHFHRVFRRATGETPAAYTRRVRLERAAFRLLFHRGSILEVALECGFRNHETFSRAFGRHFGVTPREYRRRGELAKGLGVADRSASESEGAEGYTLSATKVVERGDAHLAFIRHHGPYESVPPRLFDELLDWASRRGLPGSPKLLGIGHDSPAVTAPARLRFDAALRVPGPFESEARVAHQRLAGGSFAVTSHVGPFSTLSRVYPELTRRALALPRHAFVGLPAIEVYHSTRLDLEDPLTHTDVYLPVTPVVSG